MPIHFGKPRLQVKLRRFEQHPIPDSADAHFISSKAKLLRKPDCRAVSVPKQLGIFYALAHILSIYSQSTLLLCIQKTDILMRMYSVVPD